MDPTRARIGALLIEHLDELLDVVVAAFERSIPRVAACTPEEREMVVSGTRAGLRSFARLLADHDQLAAVLLARARAATIERAGEVFSQHEILEMMQISRRVVVHTMRDIAGEELHLDDAQRARLDETLDAFLTEIARAEGYLLPESTVDLLLASAEAEEPDLR
jgi:hypothetical protein